MRITIGIDASNLRSGGGITHLREMLAAAESPPAGVARVVVWGAGATLGHLPVRPWLAPVRVPALEGGAAARRYWQSVTLARIARASVDVLFVPGGTYAGSFRPFVTMSRNLLPFDLRERARYDGSLVGLRLRALSISQTRSFRRAAGVIFLTDTAKAVVTARTGELGGRTAVIPHGIAQPFFAAPRVQRDLSVYTFAAPFRWLYVSIIDLYKHQAKVAEAVAILRAKGLPISVDFVGPAYPPALKELETAIARLDPASAFLRYRGPIAYVDLPAAYQSADGAVFASTCENMPNILLESMASGLPIACSNRSVMPEVLGAAGVYFDPESAPAITVALETLLRDADLRAKCAAGAYERASRYSWERCARQTFDFIARVTCPQWVQSGG